MMDKAKKLGQIADAMAVVESLMREYNETVLDEWMNSEGFTEQPARITDISIDKTDGAGIEIHLHGNFHDIDIPFAEGETTNYDNHTIHNYACRFRGTHLTACEFEWHLEVDADAELAI